MTLPFATAAGPASAAPPDERAVKSRRLVVRGVEIFYREAGAPSAPTVLLLHGFPSSSHMFRDLIPLLASRYHVVAPDYPGFGHSAAPTDFPYGFAALADLIEAFTVALGLGDYALFMQDYGGPVGFRLAVKHPERVRGLVIQNAVANVEGWNPDVVATFAPFWAGRTPETEAKVRALLTPETTEFQYRQGASRPERLSPDAWTLDQALLDRPGNDAIQLAYLFDYRTNVAAYEDWARYLETEQPPALIVWGESDPFFTIEGARYFRDRLPRAELQVFDAGHFALETHGAEIGAATLRFLDGLAWTR